MIPSALQLGRGSSANQRGRVAVPPFLAELAGRFDPEPIDLPHSPARIRLEVEGQSEWDVVLIDGRALIEAAGSAEPDALLCADPQTWRQIADDVRGGMEAYRRGRLKVRRNLHIGVGFLAATSAISEPERLRFDSVRTRWGRISVASAGSGDPVVCIHGLGGTKASFLPTIRGLAEQHRVIALDLPGFGDSEKPIAAAYDAPYFARAVVGLLDELGIERAHLVGNSMGGRIAIELGLSAPERAERLVLLSPALAWLRERRLKWLLQLPLPKLGLIQPTPRAVAEGIVHRLIGADGDGWVAAGVDEFMRSYLTPRGRAAFYAAAANIYLDEPHGEDGLWTRMAELSPETMFIWGREDRLVPIAFMRHVEKVLPAARHVELDCGHVPQIERPDQTNAAIRDFLGD